MENKYNKIVKKINDAYPKVAEMAQYPISDMDLRGFDEANPPKIIKTLETRTLIQNNSLHKWCEQIAEAYNEKGMTIEQVIKNFKMELFWTKESVKEIIIRTAIQRMFGKHSTTQLLKTSGEIEKLVDVVTKFNAQMEVEYIPWPSVESGPDEK